MIARLLPQTARSRRLAGILLAVLVVAVAGYFVFRPRPAYALVSNTTLTVLAGLVEIWTTDSTGYVTVPLGTRSTPLKVGDRVRSGPDGHAVLTYFEGSTTEIEPNSEITITQLQQPSGQAGSSSLRLAIYEWSGTTWNKVVKMVDPNAQFDLGTPSAVIAVRGTAFQVAVGATSSGQVLTTVDAQEGVVSVTNQGRSVNVSQGQQTTVLQGQPPAPPAPAPPPANTLRIGIGSPANLFLCDALGRCTGFYQPAGVVVNTMPNSWYSGPGTEPELAGLPNPAGAYKLTLQAIGNGGQIHLSVAGLNGTTIFSERAQLVTVHAGQSASTGFSITLLPNGTISLSPLSSFTLGGHAPAPKQPFARLLITLLQRESQQITSASTTAPSWLPVTGFKDTPTGTNITVLSQITSQGSTASTTTSQQSTASSSAPAAGGGTATATTSQQAPSTSSASLATFTTSLSTSSSTRLLTTSSASAVATTAATSLSTSTSTAGATSLPAPSLQQSTVSSTSSSQQPATTSSALSSSPSTSASSSVSQSTASTTTASTTATTATTSQNPATTAAASTSTTSSTSTSSQSASTSATSSTSTTSQSTSTATTSSTASTTSTTTPICNTTPCSPGEGT